MPSHELQYPTQPYSKVNRLDARASYALETIHTLINTCPILHVSFNVPDSPFPMTLPMIGQMGSFARPSSDLGDVLELYLHGYVSSRLVNLCRKNTASDEAEGKDGVKNEEGFPITVAASHLDGLILSLTPNSHSYNYRSAIVFGYASLVTDIEEKNYAMQLITESVVRDRYRHTRIPPNKAELASTGVLRVRIVTGSAKMREGGPNDEKADRADEALVGRVWTGVVPVYVQMGEPMPGPYNEVEAVPGYLGEFVEEKNREAREAAVRAAGK